MLDGRVKTLHPRVHGGILGRDTEAHRQQMRSAGIEPHRSGGREPLSLPGDRGPGRGLRRGDREHRHRRPGPHPLGGQEPRTGHRAGRSGGLPARAGGARGAPPRCHRPSASSWRARPSPSPRPTTGPSPTTSAGWTAPEAPPAEFGDSLHLDFRLARGLRYGENPHQKAAFYALPAGSGPSLARADVLQGKELSYNNLLDLDAAMKLCAEFAEPAVVIVKHTNPCGVALSSEGVLDGLPARARDRSRVRLRRYRGGQPRASTSTWPRRWRRPSSSASSPRTSRRRR